METGELISIGVTVAAAAVLLDAVVVLALRRLRERRARSRGLPSVPAPEEEAPLLEKASKLLESYNISSARLLFEHLARQGSAKAAFALAQTFDPSFFHSSSIRGMRPDAAKAKQWYKWAAKLGNEEAVSRLSALDAR